MTFLAPLATGLCNLVPATIPAELAVPSPLLHASSTKLLDSALFITCQNRSDEFVEPQPVSDRIPYGTPTSDELLVAFNQVIDRLGIDAGPIDRNRLGVLGSVSRRLVVVG